MITLHTLPKGTSTDIIDLAAQRIETFLKAGESVAPLPEDDKQDFHTLLTLLYAQALTDVRAIERGEEPDDKPQLLLAALDLLNDN